MLHKKEKDILEYFSVNEVKLCRRPFEQAAADLSIFEDELIDLLQRLQEKGVIKSLRGVVNPHKAGYTRNALIAWRNNPSGKSAREKAINDVFLGDDRISHCYMRKPDRGFNYNIFTMMHARTKKEIVDFAKKTGQRLKSDHEILFTDKELKKEKLILKGILS